MAKITKRAKQDRETITVKTRENKAELKRGYQWWKAKSKRELCDQLISTAAFLKDQQQYRYRQIGIYSRMYGNMSLFNFIGSNMNKGNLQNNLPLDRPTMNVVQSCVDTLVSRITQSKPAPEFLTDNSDYKERNLAKHLNYFINGELYQTEAYKKGSIILRDAAVAGTGALKIYKGQDKKVATERVLVTEILVDPNDALYGMPRQMHQVKLVDRAVLEEMFPEYRSIVDAAEQAYPDQSDESARTVVDQVMVVEAWHLRSGPDATDGRHTIACSAGILFDEQYKKDRFPFIFIHYSPRMLGFWAQGLAEQLMGTQVEINKLLMTISKSINLVGVPRVFVEDGSKVVKAHINNDIGAIVTYRGTKPSYEIAPCVPQEIYAQLQRLIEYAYQQSGISSLAATSMKPAGLNSGEAIRNYDDLQTDRFATVAKRYEDFYIDLAYQIIDYAKDIAEEEGSYMTVYPNKDGTREVDLPASRLVENPFIIQCFDTSSLPREPAGRLQKVTEMMQAGMITLQEGRRLLSFPDLGQADKLANAAEERILQVLDDIVDSGKYSPPDPFMDLQMAITLTTQYINLYTAAKLEERKADLLRTFFTQVQTLIQEATAPPPQPMMGGSPQAVPQAPPVSELLPNAPQGAA